MRRCGKEWLRIAPLLLLAASAPDDGTVRECRGAARVCRILWEGEAELASMLVSGDVRIVERLFAEDAVWTLAGGQRWTKREALAALRTAPRMTRSRLDRASVQHHGAVAIVQWDERWHDPATDREERAFGTDTWLRRGGRWQIVASQEARPPAPAAR